VFGFGFVAGFKWGFPSCLRGPLGLSPTSSNKDCLVSNCYEEDVWSMDFKRPLTPVEAAQWETFVRQLNEVQLNEDRYKMIWKLEKSGCYSTKSMYQHLLVTPVFPKKTKCISYVCQDQNFTHMIDK
jgi:hypothetical protein